MISVGIDVSKGKSTVCILKPYGEVLMSPREYNHVQNSLNVLVEQLKTYDDEIHIIMEATGNYHLPIHHYLKLNGFQVFVVNPLEMKRYRCQGIRNPKTDKIDAIVIAQYGIDFWFRSDNRDNIENLRRELKLLGSQYLCFMKTRQNRSIALANILDLSLPGIYGILDDYSRVTGTDKQADFVYDFYHRDCIVKYSEKKFVERYENWTKKKGYRFNEEEARQLYSIAKECIPTLDFSENTKLIVRKNVEVLKEVDASLYTILTRMTELAKQMPEYETVMSMKGMGQSLGPRIIAEIGDPRRFHSAKALIAYAGIDAPPYQSGRFTGTERHMSKRGSKILRKIGYELLDVINKHKNAYKGDPVCEYFIKKRAEGKPYRVAMFAAYNKFLRIYHSRVSKVLNEAEMA